MRIDAGLIIGIALEFVIMLYFCKFDFTTEKELLYEFCNMFYWIFNHIWSFYI